MKSVKKYGLSCACHEGVRGSGNLAPLILNLVTSWRCVVDFAPQPLLFPDKEPSVAGVGTLERRKLYGPCRTSEHDFPVF